MTTKQVSGVGALASLITLTIYIVIFYYGLSLAMSFYKVDSNQCDVRLGIDKYLDTSLLCKIEGEEK